MKHFRHRNGNGKKFGLSEVCASSFLDKKSFAGTGANVWQSNLKESSAQGNCLVLDSDLDKTSIGEMQSSNSPVCSKSKLFRSVVTGNAKVFGAEIYSSIITDNVLIRVKDNIAIDNCKLSDNVVIEGNSILKNIVLNGKMRIGGGVWERPPRYTEIITENGSHLGVTEAKDGFAYIGCTPKLMSKWIKKRTLWRKIDGWTMDTANSLKLIFEEWLDEPV